MAIQQIYICDRTHNNLALSARTATEHIKISTLRHGEFTLDVCNAHLEAMMRFLKQKGGQAQPVTGISTANGLRPKRNSPGTTDIIIQAIITAIRKIGSHVKYTELCEATKVSKNQLHHPVQEAVKRKLIVGYGNTGGRCYGLPNMPKPVTTGKKNKKTKEKPNEH